MLLTVDTDIDMGAAEQVMLRETLKALLDRGWRIKSVSGTEDTIELTDIDQVIQYIAKFDDYMHIVFSRSVDRSDGGEDTEDGWIAFLPDNGAYCISDFSVSIPDFPHHVFEEVSKVF